MSDLIILGIVLFALFSSLFVEKLIKKNREAKRANKRYDVVIKGVTISYQDLDRILRHTFKNKFVIQNVQLIELDIVNCPKELDSAKIRTGRIFDKPMDGYNIQRCHFITDSGGEYVYFV